MTDKKIKVSVVIPARNEAETIGAVLGKTIPYCDELLVIDGCSQDSTREIAERMGVAVHSDDGAGKGAAIRLGLQKSSGEYVVFMDADGSHDPADIPRMIAQLDDGSDLVVGSRLLGGSDEIHGNITNYVRMVGAGFITLVINLRWSVELTDVENGFRAVKREVGLDLDLTANCFLIEQEMVTHALKKRYRVAEISSHEYERQGGKSKLPTWEGAKFLLHLLKEIIL